MGIIKAVINGANGDSIYPKTSADQVVMADGSTVESKAGLVAAQLAEITQITPEQFGYDEAATDTERTASIQRALNDAVVNHKSLTFVDGKTYQINAPLIIAPGSKWIIDGGTASIRQNTSNAPILEFSSTTTTDSYSDFSINNIRGTWASNQTGAQNKSFVISFKATALNSWGVWNFFINNIINTNGYGCVGNSPANDVASTVLAVWSGIFGRLFNDMLATGSVVRINFPGDCGNPNLKFQHIYARGEKAVAPIIDCRELTSCAFENLELNSPASTLPSVIKLEGCKNIEIGLLRVEGGTFGASTGNRKIIETIYVRGISIKKIELQRINIQATASYKSYVVYNYTARTPIIVGDIVIDGIYGNVNYLSLFYAGGGGYINWNGFLSDPDSSITSFAYPYEDTKNIAFTNSYCSTAMVGDANVTLSSLNSGNYAENTQVYYVPITANRAVNLPAARINGQRFKVIREAGATGAFRVDVKTGSTVLKSLAAGQYCDVAVVVKPTSPRTFEWHLVGFGSL